MKKEYTACSNTNCADYEKDAQNSSCDKTISNCTYSFLKDMNQCPYYIPIPPIDLNTKTPIIVTEDVRVWVWEDDVEQAKYSYLYSVDNRSKWPVTVWDYGKTAKEHNFSVAHTTYYEHASLTDPRKPKKKVLTIDGKDIELSAESFNNLKDYFNELED